MVKRKKRTAANDACMRARKALVGAARCDCGRFTVVQAEFVSHLCKGKPIEAPGIWPKRMRGFAA